MCSNFPIHTLATRDLRSIFEVRNYLSNKFHIFSTHEIYFTMKNIVNYGMYYSIVENFEANFFEVISQW